MIERDSLRNDVFMAGRVKRYHTWPTINTETIAEHSWGVAMVYCRIFGTPNGYVFRYILEHDLTELWTGDLPFPIKREFPLVARTLGLVEDKACTAMGILPQASVTLNEKERTRIKFCDLTQMLLFGLLEISMGNRLAQPIIDGTAKAILALGLEGDDRLAAGKFWEADNLWTRIVSHTTATRTASSNGD